MSESKHAFKVIFVTETGKAGPEKYRVELALRSSFHEDLEDGDIKDIIVGKIDGS